MVEFDEEIRGDVCVLRVAGEIDMASADVFRDRLLAGLERVDSLEVDLSRVTFMDSSGLSALVQMHKKAAASDKKVVLVDLSAITARLLEITGLRDVFDIQSSRR